MPADCLHRHPELVREAGRDNFVSASVAMERDYRFLRPEGSAVGFGWQIQDLHPAGACGDATDADAPRGAQLLDGAANDIIALIGEIARYPLSAVKA